MNFMNQDPKMTSYVSFALMILVWWSMTRSLAIAAGMIIMLLIHELGHYYAAKHEGVPVTPPVFTPFGAFIMTPGHRDAQQEAFIAIAGPVAGTAAALIAFVLGVITSNSLLIQIAHWGFLINLFNLIPLSPLDGGRISMAIDRRLWMVGAPLMVYAFLQMGPPSMFNLLFFGFIGWQAWQDVKQREEQARYDARYFNVGQQVRLTYAASYIGLAAFLSWAFFMPSGLFQLFSFLR